MTAMTGESRMDVAGLATSTRMDLARWAPTPRSLPLELAIAVGLNGRSKLNAEAWGLTVGDVSAECRLVTIRGISATIFNCLIVPDEPGRTPILVADFLANHDELRLAFLDVQVPGIAATTRGLVAEAGYGLLRRYAHLPGDDPPEWAVAHSTGAYLCVRPAGPEQALQLLDAYRDYLGLWVELAAGGEPFDRMPMPQAAAALAAMFHEHLESAPNLPFLDRQFGSAWARRFCDQFLYRVPNGGCP